MRYLKHFLSVMNLGLALTACGTSGTEGPAAIEPSNPETPAMPETTEPAAADNLANTAWRLESYGPLEAEEPVIEGSSVTLMFETPGQAVGSGGCNSFGTDYQVKGDALIFGEIVSTMMACTEEGITEQEQQYFEALRSADEFELVNDQLTIYYDNGQQLLNFVAE